MSRFTLIGLTYVPVYSDQFGKEYLVDPGWTKPKKFDASIKLSLFDLGLRRATGDVEEMIDFLRLRREDERLAARSPDQ